MKSNEYFDSTKMVRARFPNLKPSTQSISLRLPLSLLEAIRIEANKRDVPYQSLIKVWLSEQLKQQSRKKSVIAYKSVGLTALSNKRAIFKGSVSLDNLSAPALSTSAFALEG